MRTGQGLDVQALPLPRHRQPAAPAGRAVAWTIGPPVAALLAREASRVTLATAGIPGPR
jgi:hypothetical protein